MELKNNTLISYSHYKIGFRLDKRRRIADPKEFMEFAAFFGFN